MKFLPNRLSTAIPVYLFIIMLITGSVLIYVGYLYSRIRLIDSVEHESAIITSIIASELAEVARRGVMHQGDIHLDRIKVDRNLIRALVVDADEYIYLSSDTSLIGTKFEDTVYSELQYVADEIPGGSAQNSRFLAGKNETLTWATINMFTDYTGTNPSRQARLIIHRDVSRAVSMHTAWFLNLSAGSLLVLFLSSILLWLFLRNRITLRLKMLLDGIRAPEMLADRLSVYFNNKDELSTIAGSLRMYTTRLLENTEKIAESERLLRTVLDGTDDIVLAVEPVTRIARYCNQGACKAFGLQAHEIIGKNTRHLTMDDEHYKELGRQLKPAYAMEKTVRGFFETRRASGEIFPFKYTAIPITSGAMKGYIIVFARDLSDMTSMEMEVERNQELLHAVLNSSSSAVLVFDTDSQLIFQNPAARRLLSLNEKPGFSPVIPGGLCWRFPDGSAMIEEDQPVSRALHGDNFSAEEILVTTSEDRVINVLCTGARVMDSKGNVLGAILSLLDNSEKLELRKRLQTINRMFQQAEKQAGMGHYIWDYREEKLVMCSENYASLIGMTREEVLETHSSYEGAINTVHPDDREMYYKLIATAHEGHQETAEIDYRCLTTLGETLHVHKSWEFEYDENGNPMRSLGTLQDISSLKRNEEELRNLVATLDMAQEIANLGSWEYDHTSKLFLCSREFYNIIERDYENEMVDSDLFDSMIHPEDLNYVDNVFNAAMERQEPFNITFRLCLPDDRIKFVNERCTTHQKSEGGTLVTYGTLQDVTEEMKASNQLNSLAKRNMFIAEVGQKALQERDFTDLRKLCDITVRGMAKLLDVKFVKVLELEEDRTSFLLIAGVGWKEGWVGRAKVSTGKESQAGYTLGRRDPVVVNDIKGEWRFSAPPILIEHDVQSGVSVIIGSPDNPFGVLAVHSLTQRIWSDDEIVFIQSMANVLAEAFNTIKDRESILQNQQRLREMYKRLVGIQEQERMRMAREVHDELGQILTGLRIDLFWIKKNFDGNSEVGENIDQAVALTNQALQTTRNLSQELHPSLLYDLGLIPAMEALLKKYAERAGFSFVFDHKINTVNLGKAQEVTAYRIFQETLTNIIRHSQATFVHALLLETGGYLCLSIRDDGKGFEPHVLSSSKSIGLFSIKERASEIGASVNIDSSLGNGTEIKLFIPMQKTAEQA